VARHLCIPPARSGLVRWCAIGLFLDDVPRPGEEGDPVALAEARTSTFSWCSKVLLGSTPTIHGISRIEREYEASDQRRYFVPCPHCGHMQ
jgi:phage terminase large subunit GpA-like protein